jgi:hypothetical protein
MFDHSQQRQWSRSCELSEKAGKDVAQVFLSYDRDDIQRIELLVRALEACGLSVFWDRDIAAGSYWREVIGHELSSAGCVVVAWSYRSVESSWVVEEAEEAKAGGLLVPVCIDRVRPPIGFRAVQAADLCAWTGEASDKSIKLLVATIMERLERSLPRLPISATPLDDPRVSSSPPLDTAVQSALMTRVTPTPAPQSPRRIARALRVTSLVLAAAVVLTVGLASLTKWSRDRQTERGKAPVATAKPSVAVREQNQASQAPSSSPMKEPTAPAAGSRIDGIDLNAGDPVYRRTSDHLEFSRVPIDTVSEGKLVLSGKLVSHDEVSPAALSHAHEWKVGEVVLLSARKAPVVYSGLVRSIETNRLVIDAWNPLRKAPEVILFDLEAPGKHSLLTEPVPARDAWQESLKAQLLKLLRSVPLPPRVPRPPRGPAHPNGPSCSSACTAALGSCCQGTSTGDCLARKPTCKRAYFSCREECTGGTQ